ncbi:hypothetical protein NPIL_311661 [Nephila pilipes]|uniref:Uncharacterized protein n=1 Tax=Nephila pilipes TaxID=299642 RepID=A0A8X6U6V6_NEPPI|nr:hypothetical protein NPIL_311661 [Nephila pilipes]
MDKIETCKANEENIRRWIEKFDTENRRGTKESERLQTGVDQMKLENETLYEERDRLKWELDRDRTNCSTQADFQFIPSVFDLYSTMPKGTEYHSVTTLQRNLTLPMALENPYFGSGTVQELPLSERYH